MAHGRALAMIGGHLALDFANTAGWHASEHRIEHLPGYGDLVTWARRAGALSARAAAGLRRTAQRRPRQAEGARRRAVALRERIYRVFAAIAQGRAPSAEDLVALHAARTAALRAAALRWRGTGVGFDWPGDAADLDRPLYPIALEAAALLGALPAGRLRQCGNHPCGWLFIDTSRSGRRRWCSSQECGNISRVRRFRARRSAGARRGS
jgi:predicted RNA-binding Zn ribbon-like protein